MALSFNNTFPGARAPRLEILANGRPLRYFPLGKSEATHISLAIVESHPAGTRLSLQISAPRGEEGLVIVDVGLLELPL